MREVANPWRAGCGESRMPGSEGGVRKRTEQQRALLLPYDQGGHQSARSAEGAAENLREGAAEQPGITPVVRGWDAPEHRPTARTRAAVTGAEH